MVGVSVVDNYLDSMDQRAGLDLALDLAALALGLEAFSMTLPICDCLRSYELTLAVSHNGYFRQLLTHTRGACHQTYPS